MSAGSEGVRGMPISVQILALLLGGLVVAGLSTFVLTALVPDRPDPPHSFAQIAAALRGSPEFGSIGGRLVRTVDPQPPALGRGDWMSERASHDLARFLGARDEDVRLALVGGAWPMAGADGAMIGGGPPKAPLSPRGQAAWLRPPENVGAVMGGPVMIGGPFAAPPPESAYLLGDFVAATRTGPRRWVTVHPRRDGVLNRGQRRVLLWFGLSFAVIAPVGWLFARRLARPLRDFAAAAERLGRDPSAELPPLEGPAEIGRAARAFNLMQRRLKRYIDDRVGMIGAISHDLRTPLARMRFRLERSPPELRAEMSRDIAQMEEMITSVLTFMREEVGETPRERVDLRSILEVVVDDAMGGEIVLTPGSAVAVEVNLISIQRVFENLVENALKYSVRASIDIFIDGEEAVVEVADEGPGLSEHELEAVFRPFYRGTAARASGKGGVGLGLAVSRSSVRAHGGDLSLLNTPRGLIAQVRLPLAPAKT